MGNRCAKVEEDLENSWGRNSKELQFYKCGARQSRCRIIDSCRNTGVYPLGAAKGMKDANIMVFYFVICMQS